MNFERGMDPKEAMNIGETFLCKKEWNRGLCQKCPHADFGWRSHEPKSKNYCKKSYWGIPGNLNVPDELSDLNKYYEF